VEQSARAQHARSLACPRRQQPPRVRGRGGTHVAGRQRRIPLHSEAERTTHQRHTRTPCPDAPPPQKRTHTASLATLLSRGLHSCASPTVQNHTAPQQQHSDASTRVCSVETGSKRRAHTQPHVRPTPRTMPAHAARARRPTRARSCQHRRRTVWPPAAACAADACTVCQGAHHAATTHAHTLTQMHAHAHLVSTHALLSLLQAHSYAHQKTN
jgi:hypothetical protein